jgi:hypothetical protein
VLKINPANQEVSIMAEGTLPDGQWKWHGGLASEAEFEKSSTRELQLAILSQKKSLNSYS